MFVRVVRFADVQPEQVDALLARIDEAGGPPPDAPVKGLQILFDEEHRTSVVLQLFESEEDMRRGGAVFAAMDPSDTPGRRVSVDECELRKELSV